MTRFNTALSISETLDLLKGLISGTTTANNLAIEVKYKLKCFQIRQQSTIKSSNLSHVIGGETNNNTHLGRASQLPRLFDEIVERVLPQNALNILSHLNEQRKLKEIMQEPGKTHRRRSRL